MFLRSLIVFVLASGGSSLYAGAHLGVSGWTSLTNAPLQETENSLMSASISFDLFEMLRIGYTYRVNTETTRGTREARTSLNERVWAEFQNQTETTRQSIDLTVVPFASRYVVPFFFVGMMARQYTFRMRAEDINDNQEIVLEVPVSGEPLYWGWNLGAGFRIPLSREFSIKITHTLSEAERRQGPDGNIVPAIDSYTEYGITYSL